MSAYRVPVEVRFWNKVNKTEGCWLWTGANTSHATKKDGYGVLGLPPAVQGGKCKQVSVHRLSWELHFGPIPDGKMVLHKCDTTLCVRPDHLFLGDALDNYTDMVGKGRKVFAGPKLGSTAKLTQDQVTKVRELRASGVLLAEVAKAFGVSMRTITDYCTKEDKLGRDPSSTLGTGGPPLGYKKKT